MKDVKMFQKEMEKHRREMRIFWIVVVILIALLIVALYGLGFVWTAAVRDALAGS